MGSCLTSCFNLCFPSNNNAHSNTSSNADVNPNNQFHKNKLLKRTLHKEPVKIDSGWTFDELEKQRAGFWDTAPAYDGKIEIWQALKAAVAAIQDSASSSPDYEHAQIILDSVGVTLPNGSLEDSYDELGTRYSIPIWVIVTPKMFKENSNTSLKSTKKKTTRLTNDEEVSNLATLNQTEQKQNNEELVKSGQNHSSNIPVTATINTEQNTLDKNNASQTGDGTNCLQSTTNKPDSETSKSPNIENTRAEMSTTGSTSWLTLRLMSHASSKSSDMKLENCPQKFTILQCKQLLSHHYQLTDKQVWFCAGRLLKNDWSLKKAGIPEDFMIQVHLK